MAILSKMRATGRLVSDVVDKFKTTDDKELTYRIITLADVDTSIADQIKISVPVDYKIVSKDGIVTVDGIEVKGRAFNGQYYQPKYKVSKALSA